MNEKLTPPEQDDAILEKVTGGIEVASFLYRCPKCGREERHMTNGVMAKPKCIFCMVNMETVEGTMQEEIL